MHSVAVYFISQMRCVDAVKEEWQKKNASIKATDIIIIIVMMIIIINPTSRRITRTLQPQLELHLPVPKRKKQSKARNEKQIK